MYQPAAVAFIAFADVWPRGTGNGDRRRPIRHWHGKNFDLDLIRIMRLRITEIKT